jgi:hypothetical protein
MSEKLKQKNDEGNGEKGSLNSETENGSMKSEKSNEKRLEDIYSKLPDKDLGYWKSFYTKDLNSESEYLRKRAQRMLGMVVEAEKLISEKERPTIEKGNLDILQKKIIESETATKTIIGISHNIDTVPENISEPQTTKKKEETPKVKIESIAPSGKEIIPGGEKKEPTILNQQAIETAQENELVESLSGQELKVIENEMKTFDPLPFESQKTKTDIGIFLRNQVVKFVSGFKISESIKKITHKLRIGALIGTGILVLWPANSTEEGTVGYKPENVGGNIYSLSNDYFETSLNQEKNLNFDYLLYNQLSPNAKAIYSYSLTKVDSSYIIVDKPTATMYVISKDKALIASFPVLLGKTKGEAPNQADPDSDIAGPYATTPAGRYNIGQAEDSIANSDILQYKGKIFSIYKSGNLALHITYPEEYKIRTAALDSLARGIAVPSTARKSWGCINIDEENFDKYIKGNISENAVLFIIPDDPGFAINPGTGKLESVSVAIEKNLEFSQEISKHKKTPLEQNSLVKNKYKEHKKQLIAYNNLQKAKYNKKINHLNIIN